MTKISKIFKISKESYIYFVYIKMVKPPSRICWNPDFCDPVFFVPARKDCPVCERERYYFIFRGKWHKKTEMVILGN